MNANFWKLWLAVALSNLGDGFLVASIPLLAIMSTESSLWVAIIVAARPTGLAIGGIVMTPLLRNISPNYFLPIVNLTRALTLLGIVAVILSGENSAILLTLAFSFIGVQEVVFDSNYVAMTPQVVSTDLLETANARLQSVQMIANNLVGPAFTAVLITIGVAISFGVSAATFCLAALVFLETYPDNNKNNLTCRA